MCTLFLVQALFRKTIRCCRTSCCGISLHQNILVFGTKSEALMCRFTLHSQVSCTGMWLTLQSGPWTSTLRLCERPTSMCKTALLIVRSWSGANGTWLVWLSYVTGLMMISCNKAGFQGVHCWLCRDGPHPGLPSIYVPDFLSSCPPATIKAAIFSCIQIKWNA